MDMADSDGTMSAEAIEESISLDSIAADVIAEMDAPASDDDGSADESDSGAASGTAPAAVEDAAAAEGGDQGLAPEPDFLTASGVSLEQFLEGVDDPDQRTALETRYKQMQSHFTKRTQELSAKEKAAEAGQTEAQVLAARVAELEARIAQGPQTQQEQPQRNAVQDYLTQGLGELITPEQAIQSEENLAKFVEQVSTIAARKAQLPVIEVTNRRFATVEQQAYAQAQKESSVKVDALFANAPQYRTEAVEGAMVELMQANPGLPLEMAFNAVVAPLMMQDAGTVGRRAGMVEGRRSAEEVNANKMRASVPSSGTPGDMGLELPENPTIDEAAQYALRSLQG